MLERNKNGTFKKNVKRPDIKEKMLTSWNPNWKDGRSSGKNRKKYQKERITSNRIYLNELKINTPCKDCNCIFPPEAMDFDHLDATKKSGIVRYFTTFSRERLQQEIDKCELVCAVCHRIRTKMRKQGFFAVKNRSVYPVKT